MKTNDSEEMRSSYDFSDGVRSKHRQILRKGHTVTIYNEDGTKTIKQYVHEQSQIDWERLENMSDDEIDLSDIPELTEENFKRMRPGKDILAERGIKFDPTEPYTITEHREDGTSTTYEMPPLKSRIIELDPDVREYFPDSESVNRTLRSLIKLIPQES